MPPTAPLTSHAQQRDMCASTQGNVNTNFVQIYLSLDGVWEIRGELNPADLLPAATKVEMNKRTDYWKGLRQ
jgi:hypothetical protein